MLVSQPQKTTIKKGTPMKNKTMKILRAWCKEMNAEVTIDEVRQHYTSLADVSKPFN
jgi:hypothetical protein